MAYIENPFSVGQKVVCINDYFPQVTTTGEDKSRIGVIPKKRPSKGVVYQIDEMLGEFIRFDCMDISDVEDPDYGWRWWKHTHFAPIDTDTIFDEEMIDLGILITTN
jgi:hypothetical protein